MRPSFREVLISTVVWGGGGLAVVEGVLRLVAGDIQSAQEWSGLGALWLLLGAAAATFKWLGLQEARLHARRMGLGALLAVCVHASVFGVEVARRSWAGGWLEIVRARPYAVPGIAAGLALAGLVWVGRLKAGGRWVSRLAGAALLITAIHLASGVDPGEWVPVLGAIACLVAYGLMRLPVNPGASRLPGPQIRSADEVAEPGS